jgi:hypothetical protein
MDRASSPHYAVSSNIIITKELFGKNVDGSDLPYFDTDTETQPFSCAGTEKE